jgi:HSP20 family protein
MTNIIRHHANEEGFDDLFRGFFMRPVRVEGHQEIQIKLDVSEDAKSYTVHAEIPGVNKEDIHVAVDGSQVLISAEVKKENEVKDGDKVLRSERYYGSVSRSFSLGQELDDSAVVAKYVNGVLELKLPKRVEARSRKIVIQ